MGFLTVATESHEQRVEVDVFNVRSMISMATSSLDVTPMLDERFYGVKPGRATKLFLGN